MVSAHFKTLEHLKLKAPPHLKFVSLTKQLQFISLNGNNGFQKTLPKKLRNSNANSVLQLSTTIDFHSIATNVLACL